MKPDPKDTVENVKHLKIQHLFDNPKNTATMTNTKKIQIFQIQNPKIHSADPCW